MNIPITDYHAYRQSRHLRHTAAYRLPPLECGRRDPLTRLPLQPKASGADPDKYGPSGVDLDHMRTQAEAFIRTVKHPGDCWTLADARALHTRNHPGDQRIAQLIADRLLRVAEFGPLAPLTPPARVATVTALPTRTTDTKDVAA